LENLSPLNPKILVKNLYRLLRNCILSGGTFYSEPPCKLAVLAHSINHSTKCNQTHQSHLVAANISHSFIHSPKSS